MRLAVTWSNRRRFYAVLHLGGIRSPLDAVRAAIVAENKGGGKMRLGLFLTTLIGLAGASHISSASDASWVAVSGLENGTSPYCAGGQFNGPPFGQGDWQVDMKGNTLTFASRTMNRSYTVDLKALQPDGSGKGVGKDDKNRDFYVTFDPGSGARPFQVTNSITPCTTVFTPKA